MPKLLVVLFLFISFGLSGQSGEELTNATELAEEKENEGYWYADKPLEKVKEKRSRSAPVSISPMIGSVLNILMWVIICGAIGLMLYFIIKNLDFGKSKINNNVKPISTEVTSEKELRELSYEPLIDQAISEQDFRLATRWYYLWLLKTLSERDKIVFNKVRTNNEYKRDLKKVYPEDHAFLRVFNSCVRNYEHVWFGSIDLGKEQFELIQNRFKEGLENV